MKIFDSGDNIPPLHTFSGLASSLRHKKIHLLDSTDPSWSMKCRVLQKTLQHHHAEATGTASGRALV